MSGIVAAERYAQRRAGGKMHLVSDYGAGRVSLVARCGIRPAPERVDWRMTSNVPWANACGRCRRCTPESIWIDRATEDT